MSVRWTLLIAATLPAVLPACGILDPRPERRTLLVQHHAMECMGLGPQLCLLVREPGAPDFSNHYGGIDGFSYEWGHVYEIDVDVHRISNPPADGSSIRMELRRVVARERVAPGTEFEMFVTSGPGRLQEVQPDVYRIYDSVRMECTDNSCDELRSAVEAGTRLGLRLRHPASPDLPLSLVRWETCDPAMTGSWSCSS